MIPTSHLRKTMFCGAAILAAAALSLQVSASPRAANSAKVQLPSAAETAFTTVVSPDAAAQIEKDRVSLSEAEAASAITAPKAEPRAKVAPAAPDGTAIQVTATAGTTGPTNYSTLSAAFSAINAGTHQGAVTVDIAADTTETASAILNNSGAGSASYTSVLVRPTGGARIVTGNIVGAIIKLNGADNVTIDGRIGGTGRNLTISNTSTLGSTAAVWLASVAAGNGASNNVIRNLELSAGQAPNAGSNSTFGIIMSGTTISTSSDGVANNNNQFLENRITRCRYGIVTRSGVASNSLNTIVADNIVGPTAFGTDHIGKTGIFMQADSGATVTRNTVQFVGGPFASTTAGGDRCGICVGSESWSTSSADTLASGDYNITRNVIHDVVEERAFSALGIRLGTNRAGGATNNLVANNFIYNIRSNGTSGDQTAGIAYSSGVNDRIVFNSISITGDVDPTGASAAASTYGNAIRISSANGTNHANLTLANNSIYMDVNSNTATVRFYAITAPSAAYSFGTGFLDYNNYFVNQANPQMRTGGLGTNSTGAATTDFQTLENWRTAFTTPQDANSKQADPMYISNTSDLHISPTSPNVDMGTPITGVARDIDNQIRVGTPDIGADEPGGTTPPANDIAALAINMPAPGGTVPSNMPITPKATFQNLGTSTQTNVTVQFTITGPMGYSYTDTEVIPTIAPDQLITVTFSPAAPATNQAGSYNMSASVITPDANPANDTVTGSFTAVNPLVGGNYSVPGDYPSLTNDGGIFSVLNAGGATGNIVINITADLTGETGTHALNELVGGHTVTIKPSGAARTISGSSTNSIIRLNGADGVTIEGSLTGGSATGVGGSAALRNLTIQNTSTTATGGAVIAALEGTNGAQNLTIKNVNIFGQDPTQTLIGVHIGGNTIGGAPTSANNNNARVENCAFQKAFVGVLYWGVSAANPTTGGVITMNEMAATGANRLRRVAIFFFNQNGIQATFNNIGGISTDEGTDAIGIVAGTQNITNTSVTSGGVSNAQIVGNRINGVASTSTTGFSAAGIALAGDPAGTNVIANNMISGVISPATDPDLVAGIFVTGVPSSNTKLYYNSVALTLDRGTVLSQRGSYGVAISGANPIVELKNNIFSNAQTSGGGTAAKSYAIGTASTTYTNMSSDYNVFFTTGSNSGGFRRGSLGETGTDHATLGAWQAATGGDANSIFADPLFVSGSDLHLTCGSPALNEGIPIAMVTADFDGQPRSATAPDIGADEVEAPLLLAGGSVKMHGAAGSFSVLLSGVEPRSGGANGDHTLVLSFAAPVSFTSASVTTGTGMVMSTSGSGTNTITINLTGVADAQCVKVTLVCVNNGMGSFGDVTVGMRFLLGDTTNNGAVSASDVGDVKSQSGQAATPMNFRTDVNASGSVTATDISIVKSRAGNSVTPCP